MIYIIRHFYGVKWGMWLFVTYFQALILACRFTDYQSTGGPLLLELFPQSKPIRILLLESSQKIATSAAGFEEPYGRRVISVSDSVPTKCILLQATCHLQRPTNPHSLAGAKKEFSEALFREKQRAPARVSRLACYSGQERRSVR